MGYARPAVRIRLRQPLPRRRVVGEVAAGQVGKLRFRLKAVAETDGIAVDPALGPSRRAEDEAFDGGGALDANRLGALVDRDAVTA